MSLQLSMTLNGNESKVWKNCTKINNEQKSRISNVPNEWQRDFISAKEPWQR